MASEQKYKEGDMPFLTWTGNNRDELDIFLVDVAEADVGHVLGLDLVDAETDHQVGNDLGVQLGVTDPGNSRT